jgi:hypothetical protein
VSQARLPARKSACLTYCQLYAACVVAVVAGTLTHESVPQGATPWLVVPPGLAVFMTVFAGGVGWVVFSEFLSWRERRAASRRARARRAGGPGVD